MFNRRDEKYAAIVRNPAARVKYLEKMKVMRNVATVGFFLSGLVMLIAKLASSASFNYCFIVTVILMVLCYISDLEVKIMLGHGKEVLPAFETTENKRHGELV